MGKIDSCLLAIAERITQRIQLLTGYDCLIQARVCWAAAGVFLLGGLLSLRNAPLAYAIGITVLTVLLSGWYLWQGIFGIRGDAYVRRLVAYGYQNPRKQLPHLRVMLVGLAVLLTSCAYLLGLHLSNLGFLWSCVTGFYVSACNPLPPCKGRLKQWLSRPAYHPAVKTT